MPIINKQFAVTLPAPGMDGGDPSSRAVIAYVDIARELSVHYGKNVRQGQSFKVAGVQAAMRAANNEYDVGLSSMTRFSFCPSTSHAKQAWKESFFAWMRQKKLRMGVGSAINYDDMEFAYEQDAIDAYGGGTTSSVFQGGLSDNDADHMIMFGGSSESQNLFSMADYYESQHPITPPSRYSYDNTVIKQAKFLDKFPLAESFHVTADATAQPSWQVDEHILPPFTVYSNMHLGGASMDADLITLPELAPVHCGLLKIESWVIPDDTIWQFQDNAILLLSIWVKKWTPFFRPKRRTSRRYKKAYKTRRGSKRGRRKRKR